MSAYQVLARRWRPQRFEDLVGQDVVVRTLRNALASKQIGHAYLFAGLRGVGKTTVARLLAKALNCVNGPTPDPCGECVPCREIAAGSSMDVLEMDAASNRGIDDVRELREVARVLPVRERYRVFILDEAHQLSKDAFNALLKILEEPPAHVVFILASTEKNKFPATILSRCLQVDFRPIPAEVIAARLKHIAEEDGFPLTPGALELIARAAEGSLRDALSLLDRVRAFSGEEVHEEAVTEVLGLPPVAVLLALWDALEQGDVAAALALLREQEAAGHEAVALYDQLVGLLNSLLTLACEPAAPIPFPEAHRGALAEAAARVGVPLLLRLLHLAMEQRGLVLTADRPALAVTVAVGRLALWPRLVRVESLLEGGGEPPAPHRNGGGRSTGGGTPDPPARRRSAPPERSASAAARGGGDARDRLAASLDERGARLLAGRVRKADAAVCDEGAVVLRLSGVPAATVTSLQEAVGELQEAALAAGLPGEVRIEADGEAVGRGGNGLREQVEGDESVKRVLEVFGGRLERVEERS